MGMGEFVLVLFGEGGVVVLMVHDRNQWTAMFPERSSDIGSDLPLWAVQFDRQPGVSTVTTFMGGWTRAYAKQYWLGMLYSLYGVWMQSEGLILRVQIRLRAAVVARLT